MTPPLSAQSSAHDSGVVVQLAELLLLRHAAGCSGEHINIRSLPSGGQPQRMGINTQGMTYAGSRPYQNGDDRRTIDWRQTARRGRLYTRQLTEEHERPVQFLVDMGSTMRFATRVAFKSVIAARIAGYLAWRFFASGEGIGGLAWNGRQRPVLDPRHKMHGLMPLLKQCADASAEPPTGGPGIDWPLARMADKPGIAATIVISDFAQLDATLERSLRSCGRRHHLLLIHVHDRFESNPPPGIYRLNNGHDTVTFDLHPGRARQDYLDQFAARSERLRQLAHSVRGGYLPIGTEADLPATLQRAWGHFPVAHHANARA